MDIGSSDCDKEAANCNINMGSCLICFNEISLDFDKESSASQTLFETCCKYLHSVITKDVFVENDSVPNFCVRCLESVHQLSDLTHRLEVFQKTVSEYILKFSLEIFQRRANIHHNCQSSIDVHGNKLVLCDISGLNDFKETVNQTQENVISCESLLISLEAESSTVESIQGQNNFAESLIIPDDTSGGAGLSFPITRTFESIVVKTETCENECSLENYDEPVEIGDLDTAKLGERVTPSHKNVISIKDPASIQKPSRRTGKKATNKLNLISFVKLDRLIWPGITSSVTTSESRRNVDVLNTNTFNIGECLVYDNEQLLPQSKKPLSVVDTAMPIYRPQSNHELNPENQVTKNTFGNYARVSSERPFQCSLCQKTFKDERVLQYHIKGMHTNDKPFKCMHCNKRFLRKLHFDVHLRSHTGERPYKCSFCPSRFLTPSSMNRHSKNVHKNKPNNKFQKELTSPVKTAPFQQECKIIVKNGGNGNTYSCSVCHKGFKGKRYLKAHFRMHTGEKPFSCSRCNISFSFQSNQIRHVKRCKGNLNLKDNKSFQCRVCNEQYTSSASLHSHFRTHTGEMPYKCPVCKKAFKDRSNCLRHTRLHGNGRMLQVQVEHSSLVTSGPDCTHFRIHKGENELTCKNGNLKEKADAYNEEIEIEIPNSTDVDPLMFVETFTANDEIQIEAGAAIAESLNFHQCSVCGKKLKSVSKLTSHFRMHTGEKPYSCDQCNFACSHASNLKKHKIHRHSAVPPLKCRECGRGFKSIEYIKRHFKIVHFAIEFTNACVLPNRVDNALE